MTLLTPSYLFATQRAQLDDGSGNILGTAANPIYTTGGGGSSSAAGGTNAVQYNSGSSTFAGTENKFSFNGTNVGIGTTSGMNLFDVEGTTNINALDITSYGNVGIGSTAPGNALDVQGTVRTNDVFVNKSGLNLLNSLAQSKIYNVMFYGATGNGVMHTDGIAISGSTDFNSTSASFTNSDVGKVISVEGAGALTGTTTKADGVTASGTKNFSSASGTFTNANQGDVIYIAGAGAGATTFYTTIATVTNATNITTFDNIPLTVNGASYTYGNGSDLTTTIAAYVSPTEITLTASAGNSTPAGIYGGTYVYGTDDTAAIQSTINAVDAGNYGTVYFPKNIYILNGSFGGTGNSQLQIPNNSIIGVKAKTIFFRGDEPLGNPVNGNPTEVQGSVLYSTNTGSSGNSVIASNSASFSNYYVLLKNLTLITVTNPVTSGINLLNVYEGGADFVNVEAGWYNLFNAVQPTTTDSYGIITPNNNNNGYAFYDHFVISGFYNGIQMNENSTIDHGTLLQCVYGIELPTAIHSRMINFIENVRSANGINVTGVGEANFYHYDTEHKVSGVWNSAVNDLNDPSNQLSGYINWTEIRSGVGRQHTFTVSGGNNVVIEEIGTRPFKFSPGNIGIGTFNNVGIGTFSSDGIGQLTVMGTTNGFSPTIDMYNNNTSAGTSVGANFLVNTTSAGAEAYAARIAAIKMGAYTNSVGSTYNAGLQFMTVKNAAAPNEWMRLDNNGNLGIGTTTPNALLDVRGTVLILNSGNLGIGTSVPNGLLDVEGTVNPVTFFASIPASGTERNVGIGSFSPGQKLDVQGTIRGISGGTCTTLYQCNGGVDVGVIQNSTCSLCPGGSCVPMNGCF